MFCICKFMKLLIYILIVLTILVTLVWIYLYLYRDFDEFESIRRNEVNKTIQWLYYSVNNICNHCNMAPIYEIIETDHITYSDKINNPYNRRGKIYLVIWNYEYSRIFSHNTLIYAVLHEISHILSPSVHHEPPFDSIESLLLNTAIKLGYYDPNIPLEIGYIGPDAYKYNVI
jgi:beta-lactamase regulating signal transducer with metallopeptidase domain